MVRIPLVISSIRKHVGGQAFGFSAAVHVNGCRKSTRHNDLSESTGVIIHLSKSDEENDNSQNVIC